LPLSCFLTCSKGFSNIQIARRKLLITIEKSEMIKKNIIFTIKRPCHYKKTNINFKNSNKKVFQRAAEAIRLKIQGMLWEILKKYEGQTLTAMPF